MQPACRLLIIRRLRCPVFSSVTAHLPRPPTAAHTALALSPPQAAGKLVAMVGMTVDLAVAAPESLKK